MTLTTESVKKWPHLPTYRHFQMLNRIASGPERKKYCAWDEEDKRILDVLRDDGQIIEVSYQGEECWALSSLGRLVMTSEIARRWEGLQRRIDRERYHEMNRGKKPVRWQKRMVNFKQFNAWDRSQKLRNPLAGLRLLRLSGRELTIASRHWPHKLCWDWSVGVSLLRFGYDYDRAAYRFYAHHGQIGFILWWIALRIHWQDYGHMANVGPRGCGAPKPMWKGEAEKLLAEFDAKGPPQ